MSAEPVDPAVSRSDDLRLEGTGMAMRAPDGGLGLSLSFPHGPAAGPVPSTSLTSEPVSSRTRSHVTTPSLMFHPLRFSPAVRRLHYSPTSPPCTARLTPPVGEGPHAGLLKSALKRSSPDVVEGEVTPPVGERDNPARKELHLTKKSTQREALTPSVGERPQTTGPPTVNIEAKARKLLRDGLQPVENPMHLPPPFGIKEEVKLHPRIFRFVCEQLGVNPQIDLFASAEHHQLPRYFTVNPDDPVAMGTNAFNYKWEPCLTYYANPPWSIVGRVLRKALREGSPLLLVTPEYQGATWKALLERHAVKTLRWTKPLYLDKNGHLRPKPRWDTCFTYLPGRPAGGAPAADSNLP